MVVDRKIRIVYYKLVIKTEKVMSRILSSILLVVALAGCGGGAGGGDKPSVVQNDIVSTSLVISTLGLRDANNAPVTRVKEDQVFDLIAIVAEKSVTLRNGVPVAGLERTNPAVGKIVTFAGAGGELIPTSGTALTDASGTARIKLKAGDAVGAFVLKATTGTAELTANYAIEQVLLPVLNVEIRDRSNNLVTTLNGGEIYEVSATAQRVDTVQSLLKNYDLIAAAVSRAKTGIEPMVSVQKLVVAPGVDIAFSSDGGVFEPTLATARTNASGTATVRFRANVLKADYRMSAAGTFDNVDVKGNQPYSIVVPVFAIGSGLPFVPGTLELSLPVIAAGGSTTITGSLRSPSNEIYERPTSVVFTSPCVIAGTATVISPVVSQAGIVRTTYTAKAGCVGSDRIEATSTIAGLVFDTKASAVVTVSAPVASNIEFVSAVPTTIVLSGRGAANKPEISIVKFRVKSNTGIPVPSQQVDFKLTSSAARLESTVGITDTNGEVVARVISGTAPAVLRVIATLLGGASTQSDQIIVSTGTADQAAVSLSTSALNLEAFNRDGVDATLAMRVSDRYGNPIANGTNVLFTSEGGQIDPSCTTTSGVCVISFRSANPRPGNGRVTILARTVGDESFVDLNGDGQFNAGETFKDLPEAFRDDNESGQFDAGEFFSDSNSNGQFDGPNGLYDGLLCAAQTGCGRSSSVEVRDDIVLVLSTSSARVQVSPSVITVNEVSPETVRIEVSDLNGNFMAPGTKVELTTTNGVLSGEKDYLIGDTNSRGPFVASVQITGDGTRSEGAVTAKVTSPAGQVSIASARVSDTSICDQNFAPLPPGCAGGNSQIGNITANPSAIIVRPSLTVVNTVQVLITDASPQSRPYNAVVPQVTCAPRTGQAGYIVNVLQPVQPTDVSGSTTVRLEVQSSTVISGSYSCTFSAGSKTATVQLQP